MPIKFRYQNQNFKKSLGRARDYKRKSPHIPSTGEGVFLSKAGLGSWAAKFFLFFLIFGFIYVVYVPNIFFIKNIQIVGLKIEDRQQLEKQVKSILEKKSLLPQNNLLFLSKQNLKNILGNQNVKIEKIVEVTKKFPNTLEIFVRPRYVNYVLNLENLNYLIAKDGTVMEIQSSSNTIPAHLVTLEITQTANLVVGQNVLDNKLAQLLQKISADLSSNSNMKVTKFSLNPKNPLDLEVSLQQGFNIKIDTAGSWSENQKNLKALFTKLQPTAKLAYIDLRVQDRAYVCYKNSACDQIKIDQVVKAATSTMEVLNSENK